MSNCPTPCPSCPRKYRPLPGDGPQPARFLCVAERPGFNENKTGRVLVGKAGQEQDETYLPLAGLRRRDIRCTNAVQCWADSNRTPNAKEILSCASHHLPQEIRDTDPEVIFLLGSSPCTLCPGIRLDMHHGRPQHTSKVGDLFGWQGWIVPMYHPALGLHEGRWMTQLLEDWANVMDELDAPGDEPEPEVDYRIATSIDGMAAHDLIACDTEDHGGTPWSVQLSWRPRQGVLIKAEDKEMLAHLADWLLRGDFEVAFHHAGHDLEVLRRMGIVVPRYRDTMQEAFHQGNLPQGLKTLVYRLFRRTMTSWEDTVRPASVNALLGWLTEALVIARLDLYSTKVKEYKTCMCGHSLKAHYTEKHEANCPCRDYTPRTEIEQVPGSAESLFRRLLSHTDENSEYDAWSRLADWRQESEHELCHVESRIGPWPILGIGNCTEAQAIRYAVGDADETGQVAVELERRRREGRFEIADGDEDK